MRLGSILLPRTSGTKGLPCQLSTDTVVLDCHKVAWFFSTSRPLVGSPNDFGTLIILLGGFLSYAFRWRRHCAWWARSSSKDSRLFAYPRRMVVRMQRLIPSAKNPRSTCSLYTSQHLKVSSHNFWENPTAVMSFV